MSDQGLVPDLKCCPPGFLTLSTCPPVTWPLHLLFPLLRMLFHLPHSSLPPLSSVQWT